MSQDEIKCPCNSCGGNISFPREAVGMVVQCPHCATETTLFEEDEAVVVAPVIMAEPDDDVPTVTPSAPPPPPGGGGKPPLPKPRPGMKKGGAPPPPRPRALKAPPPSNLKATSKPPPAPRVGLGLRRRPGALAVSRAGLDGRKAPSKVKALWEDEVEEVLKAGEKHNIEKVGPRLRSMMPWMRKRTVKGAQAAY